DVGAGVHRAMELGRVADVARVQRQESLQLKWRVARPDLDLVVQRLGDVDPRSRHGRLSVGCARCHARSGPEPSAWAWSRSPCASSPPPANATCASASSTASPDSGSDTNGCVMKRRTNRRRTIKIRQVLWP